MKRFFYLGFSLLLAAGFVACSGSNDDDGVKPGNGEIKAPFTLSVDKESIESNGKDVSTFKLVDANGTELTTADLIEFVRFRNVATNEQLDRRTRNFTSLKNGEYTFAATFKGEESANQVTITAQNRSKYEKYHKNVAIHKLTNTFCVACPSATQAIHGVADAWQENMVTLALHGNFNPQDPWVLPQGILMINRFNGKGWPTVILNCDKVVEKRTSDEITKYIKMYLTDYPATCGIKIESSYANETITINASLTSTTDDNFTLGYAIIQDEGTFINSNAYPDEKPGTYWDIVLGLSDDFMVFNTSNYIEAKAGVEQHKTFTVPAKIAPESLNTISIAVYAFRRNGEGSMIDNIAKTKLGKTLDYQLND